MTTLPGSKGELNENLKHEYIGKTLLEVPTPSALFDISRLRRNCTRMLEVVDTLQFGWRVHIKTHKTTELTNLQVGDGPRPANIIVSTIKEAENVLPLLLEMKQSGRAVNILYGFPVPPSSAARLATLAKKLGSGGLSLLVDHADQLPAVYRIKEQSGVLPQVYIKIDMGYHRAGVPPQSEATTQIISDLLEAEQEGTAIFYGLYSHAGQSYYGNDIATAVDLLQQELEALFVTAELVKSVTPSKKLVLSVGATPTTTSIRNLFIQDSALAIEEQTAISALKGTIETIKSIGCGIELHAGVYPVLDVQQLATHAISTEGPNPMLSWSDLALTVIAEVASIYPGRAADGSPEALIAAGSLALGREPCKAYSGWGIVSPWNTSPANTPATGPEHHQGWQVGRISQEHGILTWSGDVDNVASLKIGQKIRIWPNHACITGACFDRYLVFDSEAVGSEDKIIDVWPRWRGW